MNSLKTNDISPPRKQIVKPYEYGEGYEDIQPRRLNTKDPKKIMNFCLITNDIEGASPKKSNSLSKTRDLLATEDIEGAQPDPFKNRERTKRFNLKIRKMSKRKVNKVNGKYSNQSQISEEDRNSAFAYANHIDYVQPKFTKSLSKSRRYYLNKNNFSSNLDLTWREDFDEEESEEEDQQFFNNMPQNNNDYGPLPQEKDHYNLNGETQNTPLKRQESQNRELDKLMNDKIGSINQVKTIEQKDEGINHENGDENKVVLNLSTRNIDNIRIR